MLKFQRNRTKPELITIFLCHLALLLEATKGATVARSNGKTRALRFGQKNPELNPESWELNGNIFFKLFLVDLDGLQKRANEETKRDSVKSR